MFWIIGHRGAAGLEPENTLAGVRRAIELGADWIEIDVRVVAGEVIVIHDHTLDRTTNGSGSVYDYTVEQLQSLDAGNGERIPTLDEVLDLIDARVGLNVEIKEPRLDAATVETIVAHLDGNPSWHHKIMVSSFHAATMTALAGIGRRDWLLGYLYEEGTRNVVARAAKLGAYSLNASLAQLDAGLVAQAKDAGLRVLVYTVNEETDLARCIELEVDGIYTDYPDRAIAFLRDRSKMP
jgi:glycerophosphoryl diester phosphodiesterase